MQKPEDQPGKSVVELCIAASRTAYWHNISLVSSGLPNNERPAAHQHVLALATRRLVLAALALGPLAACGDIAPEILDRAGEPDLSEVDFQALYDSARRIADVPKSEELIRLAWPDLVRIASLGPFEIRYMLERNRLEGTQHVSLPGSHNLQDWLLDFDFELLPDVRDGLPVHGGFDTAAQAVYADLLPQLDPELEVFVHGHSLGGAVAALISLYLQADGFRLTRTTTFGQPRVTTGAAMSRFSSVPLIRVVNADDFISMVPIYPFEQFGEEVILRDGTNYVHLTAENANLLSKGEIWRQHNGLSMDPHHIATYLDRLEQKLMNATPVAYSART